MIMLFCFISYPSSSFGLISLVVMTPFTFVLSALTLSPHWYIGWFGRNVNPLECKWFPTYVMMMMCPTYQRFAISYAYKRGTWSNQEEIDYPFVHAATAWLHQILLPDIDNDVLARKMWANLLGSGREAEAKNERLERDRSGMGIRIDKLERTLSPSDTRQRMLWFPLYCQISFARDDNSETFASSSSFSYISARPPFRSLFYIFFIFTTPTALTLGIVL